MNSCKMWDLFQWTVTLITVIKQIVDAKHKNGRQDDGDVGKAGINSLGKSRKSRFWKNYVASEGSNIEICQRRTPRWLVLKPLT